MGLWTPRILPFQILQPPVPQPQRWVHSGHNASWRPRSKITQVMRLSKMTSVPLIEGTTRSLGISGCIAKSMTMNSQTGRLQQKHKHFAKVPQTSSANGAKATGWLPFFTTRKKKWKNFQIKHARGFHPPKKKMEPKELACSRPSYKGRYKSLAIPTLGRHMPQLQSSSSRGMNIYLAEES